jgi:hypothetical protein
MGAEQAGGLDDLLMGNVAEGSEETSEQLIARIAAAQARLAAVKKDEKKAVGHDQQLAQIVKYLQPSLLKLVAWMIDQEIPSLTILAMVSIACRPAAEMIESQIELTETEGFGFLTEVPNEVIRKKITEWCLFIITADNHSSTLHLSSFKKDFANKKLLTAGIRLILSAFWLRATTEYESHMLDNISDKFIGLFD